MNNYCRNCRNYPGMGGLCKRSKKTLEIRINKSCGFFENRNEVKKKLEVIKPGEFIFPEIEMVEFVRKGIDGKIHILDRQPKDSPKGMDLVLEAIKLKKKIGRNCPFSVRYVD